MFRCHITGRKGYLSQQWLESEALVTVFIWDFEDFKLVHVPVPASKMHIKPLFLPHSIFSCLS